MKKVILLLVLSSLVAQYVLSDSLDLTKYCINQNNKPFECSNYDNLIQNAGNPIPKYVVNMDLSYSDRWKQVITDFKNPIQIFFASLEQVDKFRDLQSQTPFYADTEFLNEIKAISDLASVNYTTAQLVSQMYEIADYIACTSIVVRKGDGSIIHARNLDYAFVKYISPLLAQIEFQKSGKTVFYADMVVGTNIVVTGIVPNGFSITINQRDDDGQSIAYLKNSYIPPCHLIYKVLQTKTTYDDAVNALTNTKIAMPAYFTIAGLSGNQGTVIERDREGVNLATTLSDSTWFICQTNTDRSLPDPPNDYRRIPCEQKLAKLNQNTFTGSDIFAILSQQPNFVTTTITTDIMIPKTGYFNSTRWFNNPSQKVILAQSSSNIISHINYLVFIILLFFIH